MQQYDGKKIVEKKGNFRLYFAFLRGVQCLEPRELRFGLHHSSEKPLFYTERRKKSFKRVTTPNLFSEACLVRDDMICTKRLQEKETWKNIKNKKVWVVYFLKMVLNLGKRLCQIDR